MNKDLKEQLIKQYKFARIFVNIGMGLGILALAVIGGFLLMYFWEIQRISWNYKLAMLTLFPFIGCAVVASFRLWALKHIKTKLKELEE